MNIIICGAGRVGYSISKQLSAQGHSITVIDQSSEFIQKINDTQDVKGIVDKVPSEEVTTNLSPFPSNELILTEASFEPMAISLSLHEAAPYPIAVE